MRSRMNGRISDVDAVRSTRGGRTAKDNPLAINPLVCAGLGRRIMKSLAFFRSGPKAWAAESLKWRGRAARPITAMWQGQRIALRTSPPLPSQVAGNG